MWATAAPTLAETGSVYFDVRGNAAAGAILFPGLWLAAKTSAWAAR